MKKIFTLAAVSMMSFSAMSGNTLQPTQTPTEKFNVTNIKVVDYCSAINIIEKPSNVINILKYSKTNGFCELSILHKGKTVTGEIIYVVTDESDLRDGSRIPVKYTEINTITL